MSKTDKIAELEKKVDRVNETVEKILCRMYRNDLIERYELKGYVNKRIDDKNVLEDPEKTGWYVEVCADGRIDIYEDGFLKRRVGSDYECVWTYFPNGEIQFEIWKDVLSGSITDMKEYASDGRL